MVQKTDLAQAVADPDGSAQELAVLERIARAYAAEGFGSAQREMLICRAAPLARRLARRYRDRGESLEDLQQVALVGLVKAVDGYDPRRGPFGGYAIATIIGELKRHFRDRAWTIHLPRPMQELVAQVAQASARMTGESAHTPSAADLAQELHRPEAEIAQALTSAGAYRPVSLNLRMPGEDGSELGDTLGGPDPDYGRVEERLTMAAMLCRLPARDRQVLALRFYGDCTQNEIALALGISQMHASRLLSQALARLRDLVLSEVPRRWTAGQHEEGPALTVRTRLVAGVIRVRVGGEVDRDNAAILQRALSAALRLRPARELSVHLGGVPFLDAAGVRTLVSTRQAAGKAGLRLRLVGTRAYVSRALSTVGLGPCLDPAPQPR